MAVVVIRGCGGVSGPVLEEHVACMGPEGLVGDSHEFWGVDVSLRWGVGREGRREGV